MNEANEDLVVDLNVKVYTRGSYFDVVFVNNRTDYQWGNIQTRADSAILAISEAAKSL